MSVAMELRERLRHHYIKEPEPGGVFIGECGLNNGFGQQNRVDALHVGFTRSSGQILRGHELKVSRADWLHELERPGKSEFWSNECHEWWLVTPAADMVRLGELPDGWGHMVPDPRAKVRFKVLVKADRKGPDHQPSWLATRSIMARLDTLQRQAVREAQTGLRAEERSRLEAEFESRRQSVVALTPDQVQRLRLADDLLREVDADSRGVSVRDVRVALAVMPLLQRLGGWGGVGEQAKRLAELAAAAKQMDAELEPFAEGVRRARLRLDQ